MYLILTLLCRLLDRSSCRGPFRALEPGGRRGVDPWCNGRASRTCLEDRRGGLVGAGRARRPVGARAEPSASGVEAGLEQRVASAPALPSVWPSAGSPPACRDDKRARYGTSAHPSAGQGRGLTKRVAAAEECRIRQQKIDSRDRPHRSEHPKRFLARSVAIRVSRRSWYSRSNRQVRSAACWSSCEGTSCASRRRPRPSRVASRSTVVKTVRRRPTCRNPFCATSRERARAL